MIYRLTTKNRLDKRCHAYQWAEYYKANKNLLHGALVAGVLFGLIFAPWAWKKAHPEPLISPLSEQEVIQDYKDSMYPKWMYEVAPQSVNGVPMWMQPSPQPCPTPTINLKPAVNTWHGVASYYSRAGCIGCSPTLTMANGQPLDDNALTVAFNRLPLGSMVRITNLDTMMFVEAEVTDTGGFERLGRIIDLTPKVKNKINCSDLCQVKVEEI